MSFKQMLRLLPILLLTACTTTAPVNKASPPVSEQKVNELDRGLKALEQENYAAAADVFDRILVQKPASEYDLVVLFNSGAAYEGLGNCTKALERYRQVVRSSVGKFERIEGQSIYRASLMYECLEQDAKAISALLDARKRKRDLPVEVLSAEIPARLAAAYARIGNRPKAIQYFTEASRGLKKLINQDGSGVQVERVARTLYLMGKLTTTQRDAEVDPLTFLSSISIQQPYLLQAVEMNHKAWSPRAAEDLQTAYDNVWRFQVQSPQARREFMTRVLQSINELRKIRMPRANSRVDGVFAMLDKTEIRVQNELMQMNDGGNPLTTEAERRQGLRREGRLADPSEASKKKPALKK